VEAAPRRGDAVLHCRTFEQRVNTLLPDKAGWVDTTLAHVADRRFCAHGTPRGARMTSSCSATKAFLKEAFLKAV